MGIRTIFRFALEQWVRSLKKMILMTGLFCFSFLLTGAVIYGNEYGLHSRKSSDRILSGGLENTGVADVLATDMMTAGQLLAGIADMEEVAFIASYSERNLKWEGETARLLLERQKEMLPWPKGFEYVPVMDTLLRVIMMNVDGWALCRLELEKGQPPREVALDENQVYLYLGAGYEDVPLGTTIDMLFGRTGVVAGIFKKGQKWLDSDKLRYFDENNSDICIEMDYRMMLLMPRGELGEVSSPAWFFGIAPGHDMESVSEKIQARCAQKNAQVSVGSLEKSFDARDALHADSMKIVRQMMVMTLFSVVLIQVCVQMAEILTCQRRYGILCASGMSMRAISGEAVIKNLLNLLLGGVIALSLGLCWVGRKDILLEMALAKTAAVGLLSFAAAHVLPLAVLAQTRPARLMRGI